MPFLPDRLQPWRARAIPGWLLALALLVASGSVQATAAFARQTGSACADCHAAAYGPALTPYGMRFKINGFTETNGEGTKLPLAAQLIAQYTNPTRGDSTTNLTEADLFLAGRLTEHVGGFVKIEADHEGDGGYNTRLSNVDLRYVAHDLKLGGRDLVLGVSVNNNPSFDDPIGALPAPAYLGPPGVTGTLLNPSSPGSLANRVVGGGIYGFYDAQWYAEVGSYRSLSASQQDGLGYSRSGDPGRLSGTGYLRLAWMKDLKRQFFSAGVVALTTQRRLPRSAAADDITDLGYDLTYQYLGNRDHIVQLNYVNIMERRHYGSAPAIAGLVAPAHATARDQVLTVTYTFRQSYGISATHLMSTGSRDPVRYGPLGDPATTSNLFSLYWTPLGKDDSWTSTANLKLAVSWFRFTRFNGRRSNIFGAPPGAPGTDASDLNAFFVSASAMF
ncbi:cytochrome C [Frateuria sp.]|uniref:cytochrome C n=1 Tax=Frateuria sp. TaxID=2211372 RepID=UPI003F7F5AF4